MPKENTLQEVLEIVTFLKENAVTKKEFKKELKAEIGGLRTELDSKLDNVKEGLENKILSTKNEIIGHIDGFAKNQQTFESKLAALQSKTDRHEYTITEISKEIGINVCSKEV